MTKSELIKITDKRLLLITNTLKNPELSKRAVKISNVYVEIISLILEDIKNLDGNTVKLREGCRNCRHNSVDEYSHPCNICNDEFSQWQPE